MPTSYEVISGVWVPASSAVIGTLQPRPYDRVINRLIIIGPSSSVFDLYEGFVIADQYRLTTTRQGARNTANLQNPITAHANQTLRAVWSGGSSAIGSTGTCTFYYDWNV